MGVTADHPVGVDPVEEPEYPGLVEDAAGPRRAGRHEPEPAHEIGVTGRGIGRRMRMRLVVGQHVSVGVAPDEGDVIQRVEQLEHLDGIRTEQHQIAERPPSVDAEPRAVGQHRLQCSVDAVDVRDDPEPHRVTVSISMGWPRDPGAWRERTAIRRVIATFHPPIRDEHSSTPGSGALREASEH